MTKFNKNNLEIFDSTLREGAQTPYVNFSFEEKSQIIHDLYQLGIHFVEIGYPSSSQNEFDEISKLVKIVKRPVISVLGRCSDEDIKKCSLTKSEVIDIDLGISPFQLDYLKLTLNEAYEKARLITLKAVNTGCRVKFAALDFIRTPIEKLSKLYRIVSDAGAEWFTLCDTVGLAIPDSVEFYIKKIHQEQPGCKLSVHFHNDFDMATANTISAALNGVEQLEVTINGLGDRAGIAPMAPVVTYLQEVVGFNLGIDLSKLKSLSEKISKMTRINYSPLEPIIGDYCFTHNPGIHVAGVQKNPNIFEPIDPKKINQKRKYTIGRYTGKHALKIQLDELGIKLDNELLLILVEKIKNETISLKRNLTVEEIIALANKLVPIVT